MNFLTSIYSDIGIRKKTNQDSSSVLVAETPSGQVCFAIVCDGMGGLEKGELASAHIIAHFKNWFKNDFPLLYQNKNFDNIKYQWNDIIQRENEHIASFSKENHLTMGTTLTVSLFADGKIYIMHVGDSRFYEISDTNINILTEDQTLVAREVRRGNMTPEQAEADPRRNVLLQCIGASKVVDPQYLEHPLNPDRTYMLCSDGFRHKVSAGEIQAAFCPRENRDKASMIKHSQALVELNKQRRESDNITVLLVRTFN